MRSYAELSNAAQEFFDHAEGTNFRCQCFFIKGKTFYIKVGSPISHCNWSTMFSGGCQADRRGKNADGRACELLCYFIMDQFIKKFSSFLLMKAAIRDMQNNIDIERDTERHGGP